jgi:hypothetical protein
MLWKLDEMVTVTESKNSNNNNVIDILSSFRYELAKCLLTR